MWASWEHLGGILCPIFNLKGFRFRHAILDAIFQSILARCCARNLISEFRKIIKFYGKNKHFLLLGSFNIRSLLDAILVSTWIHFCIKNPAKSRLGGLLGRLVGVLAASWAVLEASWAVLEAGPGVLEARLSVLEARLSVLEARLGVLEAGLDVLEAELNVLEAGLSVLAAGLGVVEAGLSCKNHSLTAQIDSRSSQTIPEAPGSC